MNRRRQEETGQKKMKGNNEKWQTKGEEKQKVKKMREWRRGEREERTQNEHRNGGKGQCP